MLRLFLLFCFVLGDALSTGELKVAITRLRLLGALHAAYWVGGSVVWKLKVTITRLRILGALHVAYRVGWLVGWPCGGN